MEFMESSLKDTKLMDPQITKSAEPVPLDLTIDKPTQSSTSFCGSVDSHEDMASTSWSTSSASTYTPTSASGYSPSVSKPKKPHLWPTTNLWTNHRTTPQLMCREEVGDGQPLIL